MPIEQALQTKLILQRENQKDKEATEHEDMGKDEEMEDIMKHKEEFEEVKEKEEPDIKKIEEEKISQDHIINQDMANPIPNAIFVRNLDIIAPIIGIKTLTIMVKK